MMHKTNQDIRRMTIPDEIWAKSSLSYKELGPRRNFNARQEGDETEEAYSERLWLEFQIPADVTKQWFYGLYGNCSIFNVRPFMCRKHVVFRKKIRVVSKMLLCLNSQFFLN